jgi:hypothetical protein
MVLNLHGFPLDRFLASAFAHLHLRLRFYVGHNHISSRSVRKEELPLKCQSDPTLDIWGTTSALS